MFDDARRCRWQVVTVRSVDSVVDVVEVGHAQFGLCASTCGIQTTAVTTCIPPPTTHRQTDACKQTDRQTASCYSAAEIL